MMFPEFPQAPLSIVETVFASSSPLFSIPTQEPGGPPSDVPSFAVDRKNLRGEEFLVDSGFSLG
jgi:hypothetical protein